VNRGGESSGNSRRKKTPREKSEGKRSGEWGSKNGREGNGWRGSPRLDGAPYVKKKGEQAPREKESGVY